MSASSVLMVLEEVASDPFTADDPVSTLRAWATRNNLAHLIDESTQVRINWMASSVNGSSNDSYRLAYEVDPEGGEFPPTLTDPTVKRIWSQEFPITWLLADRPVNLDLHVRATTVADGESVFRLTARIVPARFPIGSTACPVLVSVTTNTATSDSPLPVIDAQLLLTAPAPELASYQDLPFAYEQDGVLGTPQMAMMRLEIAVNEEDSILGGDVNEIISVYLREYA